MSLYADAYKLLKGAYPVTLPEYCSKRFLWRSLTFAVSKEPSGGCLRKSKRGFGTTSAIGGKEGSGSRMLFCAIMFFSACGLSANSLKKLMLFFFKASGFLYKGEECTVG